MWHRRRKDTNGSTGERKNKNYMVARGKTGVWHRRRKDTNGSTGERNSTKIIWGEDKREDSGLAHGEG